jgi:hypothetical protein
LCQENPEFGYEMTTRFMAVVIDRLQATRVQLAARPDLPTVA